MGGQTNNRAYFSGRNRGLFRDKYAVAIRFNSKHSSVRCRQRVGQESVDFLLDGAMERAKVRFPIRQVSRSLDLGTDPNAVTLGTIGRRGGANGLVNAQPYPARSRSAAARVESSTGSFAPPDGENDTRVLAGSGPRGKLARTVFFLIFMAMLFLGGIFIGASFTANLPDRPQPAAGGVSVPIPAPLEAQTASSSPTPAPLPEPAPQPRPTDPTAAEAPPAPPNSASAADGVPVAPDAGPAGAPAPGEPAASAPPAPAGASTDPPLAPDRIVSAPPPAPVAVPVAAAAPSRAKLSEPQKQALLSRGDAFLSAGDVTSARLFYQRGADAGDGTAALRLGETFDPVFLRRAGFGRVPGDIEKAASWYRQARELGSAEAEILLKSVERNHQ